MKEIKELYNTVLNFENMCDAYFLAHILIHFIPTLPQFVVLYGRKLRVLE